MALCESPVVSLNCRGMCSYQQSIKKGKNSSKDNHSVNSEYFEGQNQCLVVIVIVWVVVVSECAMQKAVCHVKSCVCRPSCVSYLLLAPSSLA